MAVVSEACPDEDALLAYAEEHLGWDARVQLEAHLAGCRACRRLLVLLADDAPASDPAPERFGRYEIRGVLGQGGMGVVHAAYDTALHRDLAVKVFRGTTGETLARTFGSAALASLSREAAAMGRLSHPNLVTVYDVDLLHDPPYVAMELIDGTTLDEHVTASTPWTVIRDACIAVAEGVAAAHAAGVIHRDLKPKNVLVGRDGRIAVADFGLAAWIDTAESIPERVSVADAASQGTPMPTLAGAGTPLYMAPEQHERASVDERTDVFALCAMAYELLYGVRPFRGDDRAVLAIRKRAGTITPPARRVGPTWLREAILRGLEADPRARWPSMAALRGALARRPRRAGSTVALAAVGGTLVTVGFAFRSAPMPACAEAGSAEATRAVSVRPAIERLRALEPDDATGLAPGLARTLEDFAASWSDAKRTACALDDDPPRAESRLRCLESQRESVEALAQTIDPALPTTVYEAHYELDALPPAGECGVRRTLRDREQTARLVDLRVDVGAEGAAPDDRTYAEQRARLEEQLELAKTLDDPQLVLHLWLRIAATFAAADDRDELMGPAQRAYDLAASLGDRTAERDAAILLARATGDRGLGDDALRWLRVAEAAHDRIRALADPWRIELAALEIYRRQERHREALPHGQRALELLASHAAPTPARVGAMVQLASVHGALGDIDQVFELLEDARRLLEAEGLLDLKVAGRVFHLTGIAQVRRQDLDAAEAAMQRADQIYTAYMGPTEGSRARIRKSLGYLANERGDYERARPLLLEVVEALDDEAHRSGTAFLEALLMLARAELGLERLESARSRYDRVLELCRERGERETLPEGSALNGLALVSLAQGRVDDAERRFEDAIEVLTKISPKGGTMLEAKLGLVDVAEARGRTDLARQRIEAVLPMAEAIPEYDIEELRGRLRGLEAEAGAADADPDDGGR